MPRKKKEDKKEVFIGFKGFNPDWTCRGFQYEVGKSYKTEENIKLCEKGFHACQMPLNVFKFYPPATNGKLNKLALVEQSGKVENDDIKRVSNEIKIKSELSIMDLVKFHIDFLKKEIKNKNKLDEDCSASISTGYCSASTSTGDCSRAEVEKENSAAFAFGFQSKARAKNGWIIIVDWRIDDNNNR